VDWSGKRGSNPRHPPWQEGALVRDVKGRLGMKELRLVIERPQASTSVLRAPFVLVFVLVSCIPLTHVADELLKPRARGIGSESSVDPGVPFSADPESQARRRSRALGRGPSLECIERSADLIEPAPVEEVDGAIRAPAANECGGGVEHHARVDVLLLHCIRPVRSPPIVASSRRASPDTTSCFRSVRT
jgi:hypothetical protein